MRNLYQSDVIYVNGKKMTQKEFKAMIKAKQETAKPKRKKRAKKTEIQEMPAYVKALIRNSAPIKSLAAYYDNGYRQWGIIARTIIGLPEIYGSFLAFRSKAYDLVKIINDITIIGKHDEKAIFAYIQKLSWKLDDIKKDMDSLYAGVRRSGVLDRFNDKECINGTGKRLGLRILMDRTYDSITKLSKVVKELENIAIKGLDAMAYTGVDKNRCFRIH